MKDIVRLTVLVFCVVLFSCSDRSMRNMMPGLAAADSVAVMYYKNPNNPRFFTYYKENGLKNLGVVINDANGKVIKESEGCATTGKIYFYGKKGVVDVVYFSDPEACMTFSFIITGEKYFVRMSKDSKDLLHNLKARAKELSSTE